MSADGPESIPTSADPRSHRPTKKRALTPLSAQSASVEALFAKPDQEIRIPSSTSLATTGSSTARAVPEIVTNVQGSSAGAGSGEFHVYKAARRREYERLRGMDEEVKQEKEKEEFERERIEREKKDEEKTRKNREKREKMKARKAKKGKGGGGGSGPNGGTQNGDKVVNGDSAASKIAPRKPGGDEEPGQDTASSITRKEGDGAGKETSASAEPGLIIHDDD